jgi:hypothetical protein
MSQRKTAGADILAARLGQLAPPPAQGAVPSAMPAEQDRPEAYPARIPLKVPDDMKRDLELAKVEDHIEISARIRAMISLWQDGGEFRDQVDRLARTTGRPKRT